MKRYSWSTDFMEWWDDGDYVLHSDHEEAMSEQYAALIHENHDLYHDVNRLRDEADRLRAEVEEYRKDARRWRFVASAPGSVTLRIHNTRADRRDETIDAAMGEGK